jgi:phosphatidylserine/phosphatidylglycerophosphate/cardiolipin synthase-like enzyme
VWETFNRGHRKVLVCDGRVDFTGGVGIGDVGRGDARNPSEWRDIHFRVQGPAVDGLMGAFVHNWAETLNDEVTVVVFDPSVVAVLDEQFDADLERAEPVDLADWAGRDRRQ